jgi:chemotaxis signal transduction protein
LTTQKDRLAHEIEGVAKVLRLSSAEIENQGHQGVGQYAGQAADRLTQFSESLTAKDVEQLVTDTETFARSSPALFLGGAALLGLIAARFWKSSSDAAASATS